MDYGHIRMTPMTLSASGGWRLRPNIELMMSNWRFYVSHVNWSGPARNTLASPLRLRKRASTDADHH
jgi:hypothetical protein